VELLVAHTHGGCPNIKMLEGKAKMSELNTYSNLFQLLFENASDVLWGCSADGSEVLFVNDAFERVYGRQLTEFTENAQLWIDVVFPEDHAIAQAGAEKLLEEGSSTSEYRIRRPDGEVRHLSDHKRLVRDPDSGEVLFMGGVARDMTEIIESKNRESEDALGRERNERLRGLSQLSATIAHDFNNLLMIVAGQSELVQDADVAGVHTESLKAIEHAVAHGRELTGQLSAFTRKPKASLVPIAVEKLIHDAVTMLSGSRDGIQFELELDADLAAILGDAGELTRVLVNLYANAADAMPTGGRIQISASHQIFDEPFCSRHEWACPGDFVRITVEDEGQGMADDALGRCFEPFFSTKPPHEGVGIGLPIVKAIIENHFGFVHVESEVGRGTKVHVHLPRVNGVRERSDVSERQALARHLSAKILLAEDDPALLSLLNMFLMGQGHTVVTAKDGLEALELFESHKDSIDLVLSDVIMPRLDGAQAWDRMRELGASCPVIFLSGHSPSNLMIPARAALLIKPISLANLAKEISKALGTHMAGGSSQTSSQSG